VARNLQVVLLATSLFGATAAAVAGAPDRVAARSVLVVTIRLGDICPHDTVPPSPDCAPRPLPGAALSLVEASGRVVSTGRSGVDGKVRLSAQAGAYTLVAKPVSGARITPKPRVVKLVHGVKRTLVLTYFTGIQ